MIVWKNVSSNLGFLCRRLKTAKFVFHQELAADFCDHRILSRTAILEKGIELKRMTHAAEATVCQMYDLSLSVKGLQLYIPSKEFTFKAGQWVDFLVPNIQEVAGYSICSSPKFLCETNTIELAVKLSDFPPTKWVHQDCQIGSKVGLTVGGDFCYHPQTPLQHQELLLIAGGVGINPLISIMRHIADLKASDNLVNLRRLFLAYSARTVEDLIFKEEISKIVAANQEMRAKYFITQHTEQNLESVEGISDSTNHRIDEKTLSLILQSEFKDVKNLQCYVCGPSSMIDDVDKSLLQLGVSPQLIKYEKWW